MNEMPAEFIIDDITGDMVHDVCVCLDENNPSGPAWLGGDLLAFCYIEQLGALFLRKKSESEGNWRYSAAFIQTYMPDFSSAIINDYSKLKGLKQADSFRKFIGEFRHGLVHCYFPKGSAMLLTIGQHSAEEPFIWKMVEGGALLVNLLKLRESFKAGACQFTEDVRSNITRQYEGKSILVKKNCAAVLDKWIAHLHVVEEL